MLVIIEFIYTSNICILQFFVRIVCEFHKLLIGKRKNLIFSESSRFYENLLTTWSCFIVLMAASHYYKGQEKGSPKCNDQYIIYEIISFVINIFNFAITQKHAKRTQNSKTAITVAQFCYDISTWKFHHISAVYKTIYV